MPDPNNHAALKMSPPESGVKVRMYNPGFGDCFLLALRQDNGKPFYILVDCGVHHNYSGGAQRTREVAADITAATGGRLDIVIATHQHTDHVYGFKHAREAFENIEIEELWLSWAEDPEDLVAKSLKDKYGMKINALGAAISQVEAHDPAFSKALQDVLDFELAEELAASGGTADQLEFLRVHSKKKPLASADYCQPGDVKTIPGVSGLKFYILGPPKDIELIKQLQTESELYFKLTEMNEHTAFAAAALAYSGDQTLIEEHEDLFEQSRPFDSVHMIPEEKARRQSAYKDFFQAHYGFKKRHKGAPEWRRIDRDWLNSAEQLALDINNKTNNTSLVFAIELENANPKKTVLFAADAQVGNWLSWHDLTWPGEGCNNEALKAADLLSRCVLYKVGHHGSHNATLQEKGLEMMTNPDLVALIPVDEVWANDRDWEHPDQKILKRLTEKTKGRILRSDRIPIGEAAPLKPHKTTQDEWDTFLESVNWDRSGERLWIEYIVLV